MNASSTSNTEPSSHDSGPVALSFRWYTFLQRPFVLFIGSLLLTAAVLQFNPGDFHTRYGTGDGRFEDRVDSWSDRIVINTILDDAFRPTPRGSRFPLVTKGYPHEFSYYPDGGFSYYSQAAGHVHFLKALRGLLSLKTDAALAKFVHDAKLFIALASAFLLALYVTRIHREFGLVAGVLAAIIVASSVGFTLYAQNLYFVLPLLLLPFAIVTVGYGRVSSRTLLLLLFLAAVLNFLCRYEFATTYAVLSTLPIFVFRRDDSLRSKVVLALLAGTMAVAGSLVAFGIHLALLSPEVGGLGAAIRFMLGRGAEHALALHKADEVAGAPFTRAFFVEMYRRYKFSGAALPFSSLTLDQNVFSALYLLSPLAVRPLDRRVLLPWGVGLFAYVSWYMFAYHHVMFGSFYDWLPYALGLFPGLAAVLAFATRGLSPRALLPVAAVLGLALLANIRGVQREDPPPSSTPPPGARFEVAAEPWSGPPWNRGIIVERGQAELFAVLDRGRGEASIGPGTRLYFHGTGYATVTLVKRDRVAGSLDVLFVKVDRNLWPERDGSPHPIAVY